MTGRMLGSNSVQSHSPTATLVWGLLGLSYGVFLVLVRISWIIQSFG